MADLSPAVWRDRLEARLMKRWSEWKKYADYYEGNHEVRFSTAKWQETYAKKFGTVSDNYCPIVVDACVERLAVQGFRFGQEDSADQAAWDMWEANNLESGGELAMTEAVKLGESYWLVSPPETPDDAPLITPEHPSQVIVAHAPGNRHKRLAALKRWNGEDGFAYANLYLPDRLHKWRSERELSDTAAPFNWVNRGGGGSNPLGIVPVVPLPNAPSMLGGGRSDLADVVDLQDAVNKLIADMMIGSEYAAYPQRVLTGVEIPRNEKGEPLKSQALKAAQDRIWAFANEDVGVHEFSAAELKNYIDAKDALVSDLAAQTRLPPQYVKGELTNASADALKMAEMGLVSKTKRKMPAFGRGHVEAIQLGFRSIGDDERADEVSAQTIWVDPEVVSIAQVVDAAVKQKELGVPVEVLQEKIGYSPTEIQRMRATREVEVLLAAAEVTGPDSPNPTAPAPTAETPDAGQG